MIGLNKVKTDYVKHIGFVFVLALAVWIGFISIQAATRKNAYLVRLDGQELGILQDQTIVEELYKTAIAQIEQQLGTKVKVHEEVSGEAVRASKKQLVTPEYMVTQIRQGLTYDVQAYVILIDGQEKAILPTEADVHTVLDEVQRTYITEAMELDEKSFVEDVDVSTKFVKSNEMISKAEAIQILTAGTEAEKMYTVKSGDSLWGIAINAGMSLEELLKANPDLTENSILQIGQPISLLIPKPLLSVQTKEKIVYTETIKKPIEYQTDEKQLKNYSKVVQKGADGEKEITAHLIKINGFEEGKEILEEKVIKEPVTEIIVVGTKPLPAKSATGTFRRPTNGTLTSRFGMRWGTMHQGIDLASATGTPIYAADGGTVSFAGWYSGYGNLVIIDHGNGFSTYYGHCSKIHVSKGQKVAKGEKIAAVGSTGNSTGPHVHFEIRKNGTPVNPLNYVK